MPISVRTGRRQVSYQKINESAVFVLSVLVPTNQKDTTLVDNIIFTFNLQIIDLHNI